MAAFAGCSLQGTHVDLPTSLGGDGAGSCGAFVRRRKFDLACSATLAISSNLTTVALVLLNAGLDGELAAKSIRCTELAVDWTLFFFHSVSNADSFVAGSTAYSHWGRSDSGRCSC